MRYQALPEANTIESVLHEQRVFPPSKSFAAAAHIKSMEQYRQMYQEPIRRPDRFWARPAKAELVWFKPWKQVMQWKDPRRYQEVYWNEVKHACFTGDGCRRDEDGYFWIMGRIDDVLNVAGHRIGTAEIESALVGNRKVAEAAVVGRPDALKGQAVVAFVTLKGGVKATQDIREELRQHVAKEIGAFAKPDDVRFAEALPKTRSGKIMRRLLKQIASGSEIKGDTTTLEDLRVLARLSQSEE
jgi:acetyl-CoA synthetase